MNLIKVENIFLSSLIDLCENKLQRLDSNHWYSDSTKEEIIKDFKILYEQLKNKDVKKLTFKKTRCKYCFPDSPTYSFYDSATGVFIFRYVFHQIKEGEFKIEECKNVLLPQNPNGLPF